MRHTRGRISLILWISINSVIFFTTYQKYQWPQYSHLYTMLGRGLCISRASAGVINVNAALVLLPVCRGLNSLIYRVLSQVSRSLLTLWLARLKCIHITLAFTIVIAAVIHSVAHIINAVNFSQNYDDRYPVINWAKYKEQSPLLIILSSSVGLTGVAMLVILFLLLLMSLKCVRERYYDLFWATHFMFLPFMICLILHPLSGVLKEQKNYPLHLPECNTVNKIFNKTDTGLCLPDPTFAPMECQGWLWVVAALGVFSADFLVRLCRRHHTVYRVTEAVNLPGGVTLLTLQTNHPIVYPNPGQVSCTSSHTIITLLIRRRGDWTKAVCKMLNNRGSNRVLPHSYTPVRLLVDGPFCSPLENVLKTRFAICVAAGIGITPFIAVLHHLYKSDNVRWGQKKPQQLHLVWVVRTDDQLTWAVDLIARLHHKCWFSNLPDKFDFSLYVTKATSTEEKNQVTATFSNLIRKRTYVGRPNWTKLFREWALLYYKKEVTVFTCGPPSLHKQVKCTALKYNTKGSRFQCVQETFS